MTGAAQSPPPAALRSTARPEDGGARFVENCIRSLPFGTVVNVGAGFTRTASNDHDIFTIDLDPTVLTGDRAAAADIALLPFADQTFDAALLKDVLEHVPNPVAALTELARVCKDGAELIVTVPRAIPRAVWADPTHLRGFTRESLCWTFEMAGWEVTGPVRRMGSIPGAGRFPVLLDHAPHILRVPGLGHWFGLNWMARARLAPNRG